MLSIVPDGGIVCGAPCAATVVTGGQRSTRLHRGKFLSIIFLNYDFKNLDRYYQGATYTVDEDNRVVLGLPPPKDGKWLTARSYNLTESLVDRALKVYNVLVIFIAMLIKDLII